MDAAAFPDLDQLDFHALKSLILSQREQLASRDVEIEHLKLLIAKLRRQQFGRSSEKREHQIEQLELRLEELEARRTTETAAVKESAPASTPAARPVRRPLPDHLPREVRKYLPKQEACPDCGGQLKHLGEDVSEILGVRAGQSQSHPVRSSQAGLCVLRSHRAGCSAEPADRAKHCWSWASGAYPNIEIL
jgi:transposase